MFTKKLKGQENPVAEQRQRELLVAYKSALGGQAGHAVLMDLANRFNVYNPLHSNSELALAIAEGQRRVVLHMITMASADIEAFDKLLKGENPYDTSGG